MRPEDWEVLKPHLNTEMMATSMSLSLEDFEMQWTGKGLHSGVNYDEGSVMQYRLSMTVMKALCSETH